MSSSTAALTEVNGSIVLGNRSGAGTADDLAAYGDAQYVSDGYNLIGAAGERTDAFNHQDDQINVLDARIGKTAARELSLHGITSLRRVADHSTKELLAIHGVGPKAIAILGEALAALGLTFKEG